MSDVKRFKAPGPWITRELRDCVQASDYDALAAQLATANERLREAEMLLRVAVCGPVDGGRAMKRRWGADRRAWLAGSAGGGQS